MKSLKTIARTVLTACGRQKSLELASTSDTQLQRCLSTFDLTFIGIGSTLGAGIYVLTGEVARNKAGPAIILSFLIAAFASVLSGMCYAEFAARVPKAGSAYVYCYLTMGELCAFIVGWNIILEYMIGGASIARGLSAYIDSLAHGAIQNSTLTITGAIHVPGISSYIDFLAFGIVIIFTILLSLGVKNSARFNNVCVTVNILTIVIVSVVAFSYADTKNWSNFAPYGLTGVIQGASTCFFAFIGFDVIAAASEEAKNPSKSIPFSMIGTITICFIAYFCVSASITLMVSYKELDLTSAVASAFHLKRLPFMGYLIGTGATIGLFGTTLISMVPLPRLLYAMSQDGMVFQFFSRVNKKTNVPVISTVISGILIGLMAALLDLASLVEMLSIGTLLAYTVVVVCVTILRYRIPQYVKSNPKPVTIISEHVSFAESENVNSLFNRVNEETVLLEQKAREKNCCRDGCASHNSPLLINIAIFAIIFELFGICIVLSRYSSKLMGKNTEFILLFLVLVLMLLGTGFFLSRQETNVEELSFKVPFIPWLPIIALFFNIYLILELNHLTWILFIVWMSFGFVVYFGYSMHHSLEKRDENDPVEDYVLLQTISPSEPVNRNDEKVALSKGDKKD